MGCSIIRHFAIYPKFEIQIKSYNSGILIERERKLLYNRDKVPISLKENVITKENCREEWVMYKRLLAGLLAVTVTMTGISFPDSVFAAQDDTAVVQEEESGTESSKVTESEETEESEEILTEKTGSDGTETELDEIQVAEIVQTETENEADMTETEETVEIKETETEEQTEELQETEKTDARVTSELMVRGTDSFGSMFAQEFSGVAAEQAENNGCNVFSIDMSGNQASVSFETTQDATLVVAVYDENGNQMLASGKKNVTNTETETTVTINSGTIPQYYLVRGYLIETETLRPICTVYESSMYTQEMQEFLAKTTDDFDEEKVLNLDDDDTNNFAVYGDDTIIIPSETGKNIVVSADDSTNTYVIKNADTDMTSLEEGDIFSYEYADGQFIITKVASIDVNGTTVTITGDDIEMEDVFSYVKIDASDDLANATIDPSACGDGVTYEGLSDEPENSEYKAADISGSVKKTMKFRLDKSGKDSDGSYSISGGLWMRITCSAKLYLTFSKCYVELKLDYKGSLDITAKGKFTATVPLPSVGYMFYGIIVELTPSMIYEWEINGAVGADISGTFGIQADNNGITSLTTMPKCTPKLKISGSFYWGLSLEPRVKILSNNVASASLTGKAGIKLNASWKPEILKQEKTIHSCEKCIEGKINAELTLKAGVKMLSKISYNINLIGESKKIADFYYSIDHNDYGLTKCPHLSYRLNLVVVDTDGNLLPDTAVTITDQTGQFEEVKKNTDMLGKLSVYLPESRYTITPVKDGYVPTRRNIEIHMDETIDDLRITLCKTVGGGTGNNSGNQIDTIRPDVGINSYSQVLSLRSASSGVITQDGRLYMCGDNRYGYIGDGTTEDRYTPTKILDHVISVSLGDEHSGAITQDGSLYMWGANWIGQIGDGTTEDRYTPNKITIPGGVALPSALTSTVSTQSENASMDSVSITDTALDSTKQAPESDLLDQSELFEEDAVSVFKADVTETNTATGTQTASFKNLTPNDTYNFYVARSLTTDDLLASDNILDIRQAVAGEDGRMSVTYQPRETDDNAVIFVVGSTPKDLSGAQITIGNTTYNGTAKSVTAAVECDGKTLVEGRDYLVTGGFEITGAGTYTLTIIGTGTYTGTASAAYTVTCQHSYTESITKQPTCTESGIKTFTCSICGDSRTEEIPAAGHSFSADWTIDEEATCAKEGSKSHHCSVCGAVTDITAIPKTAHNYKNKKVTKRATTSKNGTFTAVCSVCGAEQTEVIYAAKTIKLSKTSMTYNGKKQKPSVTIMDAAGKKLKNGTDYKVTYPKKTQNVGKYTVTVTLKGNYTGTVKKTFTILPKNTAISKLTASKNTVTVKWKKQTKQTAGYEIQYSTSSKFTKKTTKTVKVTKNSTNSKKITKLKAKKKYYVRIRTYQTVKVGKKSTMIYSGWSKAKMVTTKKS